MTKDKAREVAQKIVGRWGYEEAGWWKPIEKSLKKYANERLEEAAKHLNKWRDVNYDDRAKDIRNLKEAL